VAKIVLLSVTEGEDNSLKYPSIFLKIGIGNHHQNQSSAACSLSSRYAGRKRTARTPSNRSREVLLREWPRDARLAYLDRQA
jgi:hypothetical protein